MPHLETIAEESYHVDKKYNIKAGGQKGAEEEGEKAVEKELLENGAEKASLTELLIDNLAVKLNLLENYTILDEIVGESVRKNLSDKLFIYAERLGNSNKNIVPNNSVKDIINNLGDALFMEIVRLNKMGEKKIVKKEGKEERKKKEAEKKEEHKKYILKEFKALDDYTTMLLSNDNFEKMELNNPDGFIKSLIKNKEDEMRWKCLKCDRPAFVEEIKKTLNSN